MTKHTKEKRHKKGWPIILLCILTFVSCSNNKQQNNSASASDKLNGNIQLSGAFALYPMAIKWAEEFRKIHPHVQIDISGGGAGKGITDALVGMVDIGMVSREVYESEIANGAYPIGVVKDAVIPTVCSQNPEIENIKKRGLSKNIAMQLWNNEIKNWGEIIGNDSKVLVHVFTRSDACGAGETWAKWLGKKQEDLDAIAVFGDPGIASVIQKDRVSIGYNNIAYVYNVKTRLPFEGITVMPVDFNNNGKIDPEEDFYQDLNSLTQAIAEDRYSKPLARNLYLVTKGKPTDPLVLEFLKYILSDGQQFAKQLGYVPLSEKSLETELQKIQ